MSIFSLSLAVFVLPIFVTASTETMIHVTGNLDPIDTKETQDSPKQEETFDRKLTVLKKEIYLEQEKRKIRLHY